MSNNQKDFSSFAEAFANVTPFPTLGTRFRGFLPVVIDVETTGFNNNTDGILEIAAVFLAYDDNGKLQRERTIFHAIQPFPGANIEQSALDFTGIDPDDPSRNAISEAEALSDIFSHIKKAVKQHDCTRAIMVAHNAHFDLGFLNAATLRCELTKKNPFHQFSCLDTVSLAGLAYGQTVLARACQAANI
ncbi:MAG TPA: exonuclease domain-containing protein, partial [Pseudomonadales bacterium]|nr:exonuclease domain-containing protein [Pseudomonadales bacterium]